MNIIYEKFENIYRFHKNLKTNKNTTKLSLGVSYNLIKKRGD